MADGVFLSKFKPTSAGQEKTKPKEFPLLMDIDRQLAMFLESHLPEWPEPTQNYWDRDSRWEDPHAPHHFCKIARPNYPADPKLGINQLWWPTGASRYARGLFVADKAVVDEILKASTATDGEVQAWKLRIEYSGVRIQPIVYVLAPRPVVEHLASASGDESKDAASQLYLLPVVDERYWWQWRFYDCRNSSSTSWTNLLTDVKTAMVSGLSQTHSMNYGGQVIDSDYLKPDMDRLKRYGPLPAAALFDALVWSIGRRVVLPLEENAEIELFLGNDWHDVRDPTTPLLFEKNIVAGGSHARYPLPKQVEMQCPIAVAHVRECADFQVNSDTKWWKSYTAASWFAGAGLSSRDPDLNSRYSITTSAVAFKETRATASPANDTALQALADRFGEDWFAHVRHQFDTTFLGLRDLEITGFHDGLIYCIGTEQPIPSYSIGGDQSLTCTYRRDFYTRERSLPPSCLIQHQLSFDDSDWVTAQLRWEATNDGDIDADDSGQVTLQVDSAPTPTRRVMAFYDHIKVVSTIPLGTELIVEYFPDRGEWVIVDHDCVS